MIYRPFPRTRFMTGQKPGLDLLMRVWRGDDIDWDEITEKHMPSKYCPGCYLFKRKPDYHLCEWNKDQERGHSKTCIAKRTKKFDPNNSGILIGYVLNISIPCMIVLDMTRQDMFKDLSKYAEFFGGYLLVSAIVFSIAY